MAANLHEIEAVLRLVNRDVWIVTAADGRRRGGLTATWVLPASIDSQRPVLLAAIAPNHYTAELIDASGAFAAHLLRPEQTDLAYDFGRDSGRERDKFQGQIVTAAETGSPILADCLAWCDCRVFHRFDAGDRLFFWADVIAARAPSPPAPLPHGAGGTEPRPLVAALGRERGESSQPLCEQEFFRSLSGEQRANLLAGRDADVKIQRPKY
ncbi:MAG TPA: flavin reductase family protein, partial [Pirellulaceae bacterium]|nr:flavin reductase family protein [Pirellulaceae bacterium]